MSTKIESLELEIKSNSTKAANGITTLMKSLEQLKIATKGGLGLSSLAKEIQSVGKAVNTIHSGALSNLKGLAKAIDSLNKAKFSDNISKQIKSITNIDSGTLDAVKAKIVEVTNVVKPLATEMGKISTGFSSLPKKMQTMISNTEKLTKSNTTSGLSFLNLGAKIGTAVFAIKKVGSAIYSFIDESKDYIEDVNLFTVAMGQYSTEAKAYAETVSEAMGIDPGEWMRNQGLFQTLVTGFGVAGDKATTMSKNLTQLGYDLSSFYNIDVNDAMTKLKSGMAGELEPLRAIGYDLSQAKLEATALELGINKSVSSMTQAEKSMLRYHAIMTQVTVTHGDMARTLDQPANQIRVLTAQVEMLGREIGNVFMPLLQNILPYAIAITKVLREMVASIASFVGFEMPTVDTGVESLASGSEDTATALDDASESAKKLKSYMMGFDELNVINPDTGDSSSGVDDVLGAFDIELPEYDFLNGATTERIESITKSIKEAVQPIERIIDKTIEWAKKLDLEPITESFGNLSSGIKKDLDMVGDALEWLYTEVVLPIAGWLVESGLPAVLDALAELVRGVHNAIKPFIEGVKELKPVLEPIISWIGDVLITVIEGLGSIFKKVADVLAEKGDKIKGIITGLGEIIAAIWAFIKPILDIIIPLLKKVFDFVGDALSGVVGNLIDIIAGIVDFVAGVFTGDWERAWDGVKDIFSGVWELIKDLVSSVWDFISDLFAPVAKWFDEKVIQPVANFFKGLWKSVSGFFVGLWDDIKDVWNTVAKWFDEKVIQPVAEFFKNLWDGIKEIWSTVANWFDEKVIQPIVNFFAPIVEWISQFFKGCWMIIQAVWVVASTWFNEKVIQPIVNFFKGLWESISGFFKSLWEDIKNIWNTVATWFNEKVVQPVVNFFKGAWQSIKGFFKSLWEDIKAVWNTVSDWFNTKVTQPTIGFFKGVWTSVSGFFSSLWTGIKGVWNGVASWFSNTIITPVKTAFKTACEAIGGFFSNLWLSIRRGVANAMNGVIGGIESAINWVVGGINKLIGGFDKIVQWAGDVLGKDWGGISLVQEVRFNRITVPTYAQGGFPDSGQAFIARENGIPEMVGTIGRRTAVANNEQIVESVASGVAEANSEQNMLLREQNTLLRALLEKDSGVYLDGRSLSASVDKYKREQGRVLITGGAL